MEIPCLPDFWITTFHAQNRKLFRSFVEFKFWITAKFDSKRIPHQNSHNPSNIENIVHFCNTILIPNPFEYLLLRPFVVVVRQISNFTLQSDLHKTRHGFNIFVHST